MSQTSLRSWLSWLFTVLCLVGLTTACGAADKPAAKEAAAAETPAAVDADPYGVPDGTAEELLERIKQIQTRQFKPKNRAELMEHYRKVHTAMLEAADKILAGEKDDDQEGQALVAKLQALWILTQLEEEGRDQELLALAEELRDDPRPTVANEAVMFTIGVKLRTMNQDNVAEMTPGILADLKGLVERNPKDQRVWGLGMPVAQALERTGQLEAAVTVYRDFATLLAKEGGQEAAAIVQEMEGAGAKLEMIGKPMDITGTLVDGAELDWAAYRGKVVLVDFWATWCGPCIAELPNVKETYGKFHEQGFDVIGISLDDSDNRAGLEKFLKDEQIPWPILFGTTAKESGWTHPMARKYNINGIPAAILVDQEGNIVTWSARGEVLPTLVEKLLAKSDPAATAGADGDGDESTAPATPAKEDAE